MQDLSVLLLLNTAKYESGIESAKRKTQEFSKSVESSGKSFKSVKDEIDKLGPVWVAIYDEAKKYLGKLKDEILQSSQDIGDSWDFTMNAMKDSTDSFFNALASGDMSGFLSDLDKIVSKSMSASAALDDLGDAQTNLSSFTSSVDADIAESEMRMTKYVQNYKKADNDEDKKRWKELYELEEVNLKQSAEDFKRIWDDFGTLGNDASIEEMVLLAQKRGIDIDAKNINEDLINAYRYQLFINPNKNKIKEEAAIYKRQQDLAQVGKMTGVRLDPILGKPYREAEKWLKENANSSYKWAYTLKNMNKEEQKIINELLTMRNENRKRVALAEMGIDKFTFRNDKIFYDKETVGTGERKGAVKNIEDVQKHLRELQAQLSDWEGRLEIREIELNPDAKRYVLNEINNLRKQIEKEKIRLNIVAPDLTKYGEINRPLSVPTFDGAKPTFDREKDVNILNNRKNANIEQARLDYENMMKYNEAAGQLSDTMQNSLANSISTIGGTLAGIGSQIEGEVGDMLGVFGELVNGIMMMVQEINKYAEASKSLEAVQKAAQAENIATAGTEMAAAAGGAMAQNSATGPYGWIAGLAAVAAIIGVMTSVISQAKGFAGGGVVGGGHPFGDTNLIRANSGELILTQSQSLLMWNALSRGNNNNNSGGNFNFVIEGTNLVGVLDNYNNKNSRRSYDYN
jgi:hypothetical protein